jgi:uncharacterized protein
MSGTPPRSPLTTLRWVLVLMGLGLPMLLLVPLGSLWLWQHGLLLAFTTLAFVTTLIAYVAQRWLLPDVPERAREASAAILDDAGLTPQEAAAFAQVRQIAEATGPEQLQSREAALAVAFQVFTTVAAVMEPNKKDPLWQFTGPEALAATEQVSRRLRLFIESTVPLGDRLTIAQLRALYAWRGTLETAQTAYDIYRMFRFVNPAAALTNEVREQLTRKLTRWGKEHIAKQLTERFVDEVGRAAIDLYGGRLRPISAAEDAVTRHDAAAMAKRAEAIPLRVLLVGQTNVGKSSLVNALTGEQVAAIDDGPTTAKATPYRLSRSGFADMTLLDTPGALVAHAEDLIQAAESADLVIWVVAANRADRQADAQALAALRKAFAARPDHRPPALFAVLTQIDRLRPLDQWSPPYDLAAPKEAKAIAIGAAHAAVAEDLGFALDDLVPLSLRPGAPFNVEAVWTSIARLLEQARAAQLVRAIRREERSTNWAQLWTQATGAGRTILDTVWRG